MPEPAAAVMCLRPAASALPLVLSGLLLVAMAVISLCVKELNGVRTETTFLI
ncbi:MAG: hypothetical protein OXD38_13075 [Aestuariivita sp.]|nr:hypothetical protein [Aestuariivita sp.]